MAKYRVADGTQVHHDGVTYSAGQTVEASEDVGATWLRAGWVAPAVESKPVKKATRKAATP